MKQVATALIVASAFCLGGCGSEDAPSAGRIAGDAKRGRMLVNTIGCTVCHLVPGVPGPRGRVGPSLERFATRAFVAGVVPNTPDTLAKFVRDAPSFNPRTAMPKLPLDDNDARDIAAFLYTMR